MKKFMLILMIIMLTIIGCTFQNDNTIPTNDVNNIMDWVTLPNKTYSYNSYMTDYNGTVILDRIRIKIVVTSIDTTDTSIIINTFQTDYWDEGYVIEGSGLCKYVFNSNTNSLVYYYGHYNEGYIESYTKTILKTPIIKGNKWKENETNFEIIGIDIPKQTEERLFIDCIVIYYSNINSNGQIYYSLSEGKVVYIDKIDIDNDSLYSITTAIN